MTEILLTNDDGVRSVGLLELYRQLRRKHHVVAIAPLGQKSADAKSLTFHKPLRMYREIASENYQVFAINGSPADALHLSRVILGKEPDLLVSGINSGDNTSMHSVFTSGTVAAALEAAIIGVKSVAFSIHARRPTWFSPLQDNSVHLKTAAKIAAKIVDLMLKEPLPKNIDLLNVNFPSNVNSKTEIRMAKLARFKFRNFVVKRTDPQGQMYYWLDGRLTRNFRRGEDTYTIYRERKIGITPISLDSLNELRVDVSAHIAKFIDKLQET